MTVTGSGSKFVISGNNNNSGNQGGATIGQSGNGTFNILAGGQFNINNTGTAGNGSIAIGGDGYQVSTGAQAGTGVVNVSGAGSQLNLQSPHSYILAGYSGNGALNVMDGGSVTSELLQVAVLEGSTGTVSVNGGSFSLRRRQRGRRGAVIGIGGVGSVSLANGSTLAITSTANNGGIYLGGNSSTSGGVGTMTCRRRF